MWPTRLHVANSQLRAASPVRAHSGTAELLRHLDDNTEAGEGTLRLIPLHLGVLFVLLFLQVLEGEGLPCLEPLAAQDHQLRSEEHTSELQSHLNLVCRLLLEKKKI